MIRHHAVRLSVAVLAATALVAGTSVLAATQADARTPSAYTRSLLADHPRALVAGDRELVSGRRSGTLHGDARLTRTRGGDRAVVLDGSGDYVSFGSSSRFGIAGRGVLTVEYLIRPDTLQFPDDEGSGYVYVLGKGDPGRHEWYARMYSRSNDENRPNRLSGYAFNATGGLGAGSYVQATVKARRWIHMTLVFNSRATSKRYPSGYVKIYRNGVLRDTDSLADYGIRPTRGSAPLRIGTGYLQSYFKGAVGPVAFYGKELSATRIRAHERAR